MKESDNWKLILTLRIGSEVFPAKHFSCITCQSNKIFFPHFVILQVWMSLIGPLREVWEPCPHRYSAQNSRCLKQNVRKKKKNKWRWDCWWFRIFCTPLVTRCSFVFSLSSSAKPKIFYTCFFNRKDGSSCKWLTYSERIIPVLLCVVWPLHLCLGLFCVCLVNLRLWMTKNGWYEPWNSRAENEGHCDPGWTHCFTA